MSKFKNSTEILQGKETLGAVGAVGADQPALPAPDLKFIGSVKVDYGQLNINRHYAQDHTMMRASQLSSLLKLIGADEFASFDSLAMGARVGLLWLASSMADELGAMIPVVVADAAQREGV
jgi:hypothetical protein